MVITEIGGEANGARKRRLKRRRISAPTNFTANETSNTTISLAWGPSEGLYVDGYKILRDGVQIADVPAVPQAFSGSYGDTGLTRNTTYVYVIYAYNRFGGESPTVTATETTPDNPGD